MDEPGARLDPFPAPDWFSLAGHASEWHLEGSDVFPALFSLVFIFWSVYTLVVAYHWLRYGHRSFLTVPLLVLHVAVSGLLMLITTAGLK